jgi:hypothetical protein
MQVPTELLQGPSNQELIECQAAAADDPELYAHPLHPHPVKLVSGFAVFSSCAF